MVMNFAHLKKRPAQVEVVGGEKEKAQKEEKATAAFVPLSWVDDHTVVGRTFYRVPAVAETASLIKTDYCRGCPRFSRDYPEHLIKSPAGYGWCNRIVKGKRENGESYEYDEWRGIPGKAVVAQCVYKK